MTTKFENIDSYILQFPEEVQVILEKLRKTIASAAPTAREVISYNIPTFKIHGNLVHFAGYKKHIGFYPGSKALAVFQDEIKHLKNAKGSVQFPLTQPIPFKLIARIVKFRIGEDQKLFDLKKSKIKKA